MAAGEALALFVVGVALGAVGVVVLARWPARRAAALHPDPFPSPSSVPGDRLTAAWALSELASAGPPIILARTTVEDEGSAPPAGSRVVASGRVAPGVLRTCAVRRATELPLEAAVAADGRRALLFPSGLRPGALALALTDRALVARLGALAEAAWASATPYAEQRAVADLVGEVGLPVETEGILSEVPGRDGPRLMRLEADGHAVAMRAVGVASEAASDLLGRHVVVRGRMARDASGYPVLDADGIRPAPGSSAGSTPATAPRQSPPAPPEASAEPSAQSPPAQPF